MSFQQDFKFDFGDKFSDIHLKSVVVNRRFKTATITFLYPASMDEISDRDKREILNWLNKKLCLSELSVRTKFMKVYVEESLIRKSLYAFLEEKFKLVSTYLRPNDFRIEITPIDVKIEVTLSTRLSKFFAENNLASEICKHLKDNFLVEFSFFSKEDPNIVDEVDIEKTEIQATYKVTPRYEIEVVKDGIGHDFVKYPQLISSMKSPKSNVTLAGFLRKYERIDYVRKTGAKAGQPAVRFSFTLQDTSGKIGAVYFASKSSIAIMDAFEENMFVVVNGDVKLNYMNNLSMTVKKIALATIVNDQLLVPDNMNKKEERNVVTIEKMTSLEQDNLFSKAKKYNDKIMSRPIVVFDVETTGLDTNTAEITEIGAVKIVNGVYTEKLYSFVKPKEEISAEVTELTGITNEMVKDAPNVDGVIRDFYDFTRGCAICGHNAIKYDMPIVVREGKRLGLDFDNELIDTMREAQNAKLNTTRYSLPSVLKALNLHNEGAHRAWNDAYATAQVLLKLNEI